MVNGNSGSFPFRLDQEVTYLFALDAKPNMML